MNFSYLDNYIDYICKNKNIPAVGVAVYRYGKLLHDYSVGYSDIDNRKPFQTDSLINLYSCSKVSTATAGMILV